MGSYCARMGSYTEAVRSAVASVVEAKGIKLAPLAQSTGIKRTTLQRRLKPGAKSFDVDELDSLARALDVPVRDFVLPDAVA